MSRGKAVQGSSDPTDQASSADGVSTSELMSANLDVALAAVALTSAGAALKGMHPTDWFCLWHISEAAGAEPFALGQLAELTGLTAGAITGVVDRLEAGAFVRRERDPGDRRRWLVRVEPARQGEIYELYAPLLAGFQGVAERYDTPQREAIVDFLRHTAELMRVEVRSLREARQGSRRPGIAEAGRAGPTTHHSHSGWATWSASSSTLIAPRKKISGSLSRPGAPSSITSPRRMR